MTERTQPAQAEVIAEMVIRRMNQVFRPPQHRPMEQPRVPRPERCGICGGNHSTSQCPQKSESQPLPAPRTNKWCDFEQKWTNHDTNECYHRMRYLREQGMNQNLGGMPQYQRPGNHPSAERAQPVLGNQPPLPGAAAVRLVQPEEPVYEGALVPVTNYYDEGLEEIPEPVQPYAAGVNSPSVDPEMSYQMDHNTLWFIANNMARPQGPPPRSYPQRDYQPRVTPKGPCYKCGEDH